MSGIRLGLGLPVMNRNASPETIVRVAEEAERIGLAGVWANERLLRPVEPIAMGGFGPKVPAPEDFGTAYDPLETLAYVAAKTSRIQLGTSTLVGLLHNPVILARRIATLDRLSGGRLVVGVGQGWMPQEFTAAGVPVSRRGSGFEEHLRAMRAVWGSDPVRFDGRWYQIPEAEIGPKPVRAGGPTVVLGAGFPVAIERAARLGFGLTLVVFEWEALRGTVQLFRQSAEAAGHDPDALPIVVQVNGSVTDAPLDERTPLTGSVEQVVDDLAELAPLNIDQVFWMMGTPVDEQLPALGRVLAAQPS